MSAVLVSSSAFISLKEKNERILHFVDQFKDLKPNWPAVNVEDPLIITMFWVMKMMIWDFNMVLSQVKGMRINSLTCTLPPWLEGPL